MLLRDTIFLVDASASSRAALRKTFEGRFNILEAGSLSQAELLFRNNHRYIAAILLDMKLVSPHTPESLPWLSDNPDLELIPHIGVVDEDDIQSEYRAYQWGATDVIFRPLHAVTAERRVCTLIELFRSKWELEELVEEQATALRHTNVAMVDALSSIIEGRSVESGQHALRIRRFTEILLEEVASCCPEYMLDEQSIQAISSAAALHDIGKITISDSILNKPARLTDEEYEVMKTHTTAGSAILERMDSLGSEEYLRYAYNICRYHHERWDGGGYPEGLVEDQIPICAQVVGLADCYDALTTNRVYKAAYTGAEAARMILNGECGEFSPALLECFKLVRRKMEEVAIAYADGFSPINDAIRAPLTPPVQTTTDVLRKVVDKYTALLHYLNATAIDIDLDKRVYHVEYNPDPDFDYLVDSDGQDLAFHLWTRQMVDSDGQMPPPEDFLNLLDDFSESGLRQKSFSVCMQEADGRMCDCTATLLRSCEEEFGKKFTLLCKKDKTLSESENVCNEGGVAAILQLCQYDRKLTMPRIGQELLARSGYTDTELREHFDSSLLALAPTDYQIKIMERLQQQLRHGSVCELEFPLKHKDGHIIWSIAKGIKSIDINGIETLNLIFVDATYMIDAQMALRKTMEQQELVMAQSRDIVFEFDMIEDRMVCSSRWEERFGFRPISEHFMERIETASRLHPDDISLFREKMDRLKNGAPFVEFTLRVADSKGRYQWSLVRAALRLNEQGEPAAALGVFIDVDNEVHKSHMMALNADRDSLTKLLNKEACRRAVEHELADREGETISVMAIIDLDNFKEVNDNNGHLFGDAVLAKTAGEISRMFRGTDVVGRIGGDEFLVFLPCVVSQDPAIRRLEILVETLQKFLTEFTGQSSISCSVGVAFTPEDGTAYEELFQRADRALYQAKHMGKGRCCIYSDVKDSRSFPTMISKRIDSDAEPGLADDSLIRYVFERLCDSGDIKETIESLLEVVGKQVDVSRVYIFENNPENTSCSNTFEWCNEGIEPQIEALQNISYDKDIPGFRESFNERGILYSPDVTQLPKQVRDILEPQGIKSLLHCAIRDEGKFLGYVGFDENTKQRFWTQEQIDLLTFLSKVLSLFLLKHRMQERTDTLVRDLRTMLDKNDDCIYVVDEEFSQIQFLNEKILTMEPGAKVGKVCYQALKGQNYPCEECPVRAGGCCEIHNERHNLHMIATASSLHWNGKPAQLITCREVN